VLRISLSAGGLKQEKLKDNKPTKEIKPFLPPQKDISQPKSIFSNDLQEYINY